MDAKARDSQELDNLFGSSILAVDAKTGEYVWHYQANPSDAWNYDATMAKVITDIKLDGKTRRVLFEAGKNGFLYVIDVRTGKLLAADPLLEITWASHVDLETGRPVELPEQRFYKAEVQNKVIRPC
jgi:glucose dehydrogenase